MKKQNEIIKVLNKNECGAVIFFRPDELVMSTGYYPTLGASFCLYPSSGKPIMFIPELEPITFIPEGYIIKRYPYGILGVNPWEELYKLMEEELKKLDLIDKSITYIKYIGSVSPSMTHGEGSPITLDILEKLSGISTVEYKDISNEFLKLYDIKTKDDIKNLELVHEVTEVGINTFYENLKPGITEGELAGIVDLEIKKTMDLNEKKYVTSWCYIHSGKNTAYSGQYAKNTGKALENSDVVLMELAICVNGYWADITRTGVVGKISDDVKNIFDIVIEAQNLAINNMKPGMEMKDIDAVARNYIKEKGYENYFKHALGHHVGFKYHDPGEGLNPYSNGVLKEGMVLTVEPGIYSEEIGFGVRFEDNILITENGFKNLSRKGFYENL
jgi:Xaa-Pro aminopeptidase